MSNLFKRAIFITDLHYGGKSNSVAHNNDCDEFVKWAVEFGRSQGCDTAFVLGDWNNNRAAINILTLDYSIRGVERLSQGFGQVFFIPGNHDLFYRDRRDVQSVSWARHIPNITIINDFFEEGNVAISPWLVPGDHKRIPQLRGQYLLGHFELPNFYMNAMVRMPDHGDVKLDDFRGFEQVFSGHFHKRQTQGNITYIGNAFPHNFSDAQDDARGAMILEWGGVPEYHAWPDQPTYRTLNLSELLTNTEQILKPKMNVRANIDIDISYEEAAFIKEQFAPKYKLRELTLIPKSGVESEYTIGEAVKFESVDQIVAQEIQNIASDSFDKNLLLEIYRNL
jgi:DNA repair exonuclease SbcCD nuclease subunit